MKETIRRIAAPLVLLLVVGMASPGNVTAQVYLGPQVNVATDTDAGIGGRVLANVEHVNLELVGSFDLYFPDGPVDFWEINGNAFYHFHLPENPSVLHYGGGGLNVAQISNGLDETELGLNLGGGVRFPLENISPMSRDGPSSPEPSSSSSRSGSSSDTLTDSRSAAETDVGRREGPG